MSNTLSPVARTPLHHWHAGRGARFADRDGWQVVAAYADAQREAEAGRAGLGLADLSAFAKLSLLGPGVPALARALAGDGPVTTVRGVAALPVADGPTLACRLTDDHLLLLASAVPLPPLEGQLANAAGLIRDDRTSALAGFHLLGPDAEPVLRRLTAFDVSDRAFPEGSCAETGLAGVAALLVRTAELTVPSVRVYVSWDLAEHAWTALLDAGRGAGITPVGLDAWRRLRVV